LNLTLSNSSRIEFMQTSKYFNLTFIIKSKVALPIKLPELPFGKKEKKKVTGTYMDYEDKLIEYLTSPSTIIKRVNEIQIEKYHRCIAAINYPRLVEAGWLTRLIEMNLDFDLSIHIAPYSIESTIKMLETELKKQKTDLYGLKAEGKIIPQLLIQKHEDTKALLEAIQGGTEKMFGMSLYLDAKSYDLKELDKIVTKIRGQMNSIMVTPKVTSYRMYEALKSILPIGENLLKITREITSSAASACFPFAITSLEPHATGILIGFNRRNNIPIIIDPFELTNPNVLILGTSGGGKSIAKDEPVLVRINGTTKIVKIGEFIDDLILKNGSKRIDDLEGLINPEVEVYTFNRELKGEWSKVLIAARKEAPSLFYNIKTDSGRRIKTTGDHNLVVIRDGKIINIRSTELKKGDYIPIPRTVDIKAGEEELNLLNLLKDKKLYVVNAENIIDKNYKLIKKRLPIDQKFDPYLYKYREGRAIPIKYLLKILKALNTELTRSELEKLRIRAGSARQSIPALLPLSDELMRLLGYVTSEGRITEQAVLISNKERAVIEDIRRISKDLGINSFEANIANANIRNKSYYESAIRNKSRSERNVIRSKGASFRGINITCKAFVELMRELAGGKSAEKRVPGILFSVDNKRVGEYLRAYFEGDGCIEHNKVTAITKSSGLGNDLSYLLLRFGIVARIQEKHKTETNSGHSGIYHQITLSGKETLEVFRDEIGFISRKKNRKLANLTKKVSKGNTNVDLIPEIGNVVKRIDDVLHFGKRRRNYAIINKSFTPSRTMLREIVREIDTRLMELNELSEGINELEKLPDLLDTVRIGQYYQDLNSRLWNELGDSWRLMKNGLVEPGIYNVFHTSEIVTGMHYGVGKTRELLCNSFDTLGLGLCDATFGGEQLTNATLPSGASNLRTFGSQVLRFASQPFDHSLYNFINENTRDIKYKKIEKAICHIPKEYSKLKSDIKEVKVDIDFLRLLADSELFWDRILEIKTERCSDGYVYDLQVDNEVFLSGFGGLFIHNSYCIKLMLMREFMEGVDINIIDPQAEYTDLITTFNGKTIKIAPGSDTVINPLDLMGQVLDEKKLSLLAFFRVLMGELNEGQRAILDDAIDSTYEDVGITKDPRTWSKRPPTLEDLYKQILPLTRSEKDIIYKPAMAITNRLKTYVYGPLRFLNQQTKINLDNRMISFDIRDIPDIGKGTLMFLLLEYIYNQMKKSKKRKMLVIDEAWMVLSAGEEGEYILKLVKTCRKFNLSLTMITQDVEDVLTSRAGRAVMANTATKILLKQDTTVVGEITERFHLNEVESRSLRMASTGNALLIAETLRVPIRIQASPEEHKLITTKPDELLEMVHKGEGPGIEREMIPELDITKLVQNKSALANEQIQTLTQIGFDEVRVADLEGASKLYIIKNETEDTDEHFVLQYLVQNETKRHTDKVLIHHTKLPDVTFEAADGRTSAIEVIADISLKRNIEAMEEKINILRKYDDYFFIVGDPKLVKYESFGEILTRTQVPAKIRSYFEK